MINKISNVKLILGLVLLGLVYLATTYFDNTKSEELDKQLVSIDTSKVTSITIVTSEETVKLERENQKWSVRLNTGQMTPAASSKVNSFLSQINGLQPDRLAAKEQSKWVDYQVDSTGTELQIHEGDLLTLHMVIGQSGSTGYLRLADESEVYASDNFGGLNNSARINHYRDNTFVKMETDSIQSLAFKYNGDSSFQIIRESGNWQFEDGSLADSIQVANYLQKLELKYNDNFANQDGSSLGHTLAEIVINYKNQPELVIKAYTDAADSVVYQSTANPSAFFNDKVLGEDYFVGKAAFTAANPEIE
ncbi:MAG: hypothetical protein DHS20C17_16000 [Cyclobacteriaceae bacterium]|nr:MAG: hypothetical protein DHS20C17_16000 [Cyclobacteriaceae bacterium]